MHLLLGRNMLAINSNNYRGLFCNPVEGIAHPVYEVSYLHLVLDYLSVLYFKTDFLDAVNYLVIGADKFFVFAQRLELAIQVRVVFK